MKGSTRIIEEQQLRDHISVFADRAEAGRALAGLLRPLVAENALVLAIPAGGFPVALAISQTLHRPLDFLVASKLLLPGNTEAGFGALAFDGSDWLNWPLIERYRLSPEDIETSRDQAYAKVRRRFQVLCAGHVPEVAGRQVILVDDGLASGATLYAALEAVGKLNPRQVVVAVPTGSENSVQTLADRCDRLVCANVRSGYPFAVASAYRNWEDVDEQVLLEWLQSR